MIVGRVIQAHSNYCSTLLLSLQKMLVVVGELGGVLHPSNLCSAGYMLSNYDYSGERNRKRQL